jgi:hypothetical protein
MLSMPTQPEKPRRRSRLGVLSSIRRTRSRKSGFFGAASSSGRRPTPEWAIGRRSSDRPDVTSGVGSLLCVPEDVVSSAWSPRHAPASGGSPR